MKSLHPYLSQVYGGNTLYSWFFAIGIILVSFVAIKIFRLFITKKLLVWTARTKTTWDNFLVEVVRKQLIPLMYLSSIYSAVSTLSLPGKAHKVIHIVYLAIFTFYILRLISGAFRKLIFSFIQKQENTESKETQANGLIIVLNVITWTLGIIFLLDNLGYNVTTLVAGLGIGGIAIALAAQAVLGDLFSYFVIFFDRPFEIGDFVIVGDKSGTIEHIGIKTTRLRTLGGDQLVCSNTDLTNSRLHNFKRMEKRRSVFSLGVTYQTPAAQLAEIPGIVKGIIEQVPGLEFDRGHFAAFGDFSLNFEFVYYVDDPEYNVYMDKQHEIYLRIFEAFESSKIEFAYPTQTIYTVPGDTEMQTGLQTN
ncbi:MAG: mechanosensitive ion channel family protein [Bacteroidota bacterium]